MVLEALGEAIQAFGNPLNLLLMFIGITIGLVISFIGFQALTGVARFTFGSP